MTDNEGDQSDSAAFPILVRELRDAVNLFETARRVRMPLQVPDEVYQLCRAIIDLCDRPVPPGDGSASEPDLGGASKATPPSMRRRAEQSALRHAPLRQMIFEVIPPGEPFTVSDVTRGLNALGIAASSTAVSNALGYWVTRSRLERTRKGVYQTMAGHRDQLSDSSGLNSQPENPATPALGTTAPPLQGEGRMRAG